MSWLKLETIEKFLASHDYDVRKSHNARWIDQKCTPDVTRLVAECILEYAASNPEVPFISVDVWHNVYTKDLVESFFKKPNPAETLARNEYDKFFQQPMEMLANAGVLQKNKFGNSNFYEITNREILDYISLSDRNALNFIQLYISKVLKDSGLSPTFEQYFATQTPQAYYDLKDSFARFTISNTPINGVTECNRIFTKVLNPLAFNLDKRGTEKGRFSKDVITHDMLMYNRSNFRDEISGKPKGLTRRQHESSLPFHSRYSPFDSARAKRAVRAHNNAFRQGKPEILNDGHSTDLAIHAHHIFPESQFPQIAGHYENLIALTPTQHMSYAHPNGHTQKIDRSYQRICILAKIDTIRHSQYDPGVDNIYDFYSLAEVLATGLSNEKFLEITDNDFDEVIALVNKSYEPD